MSLAVAPAHLLLLCCTVLTPLPCLAIPAEGEPLSDLRLNDPQPTTILVRVVGHGAIVLHLYGYIVQIEYPQSGEPLIAKDDVILRAVVRTLSGALVRPHGDWDSRKIHIYGELMIGERVLERLQLFYNNDQSSFEAPFFVPLSNDAPDGITLRVVAADPSSGNFGVGKAKYPVLTERLPPQKP